MQKKYRGITPNRRQVLKAGFVAGVGMMVPWRFLPPSVFAAEAYAGLSDPALQPKFINLVPDALAPSFIYTPDNKGRYKIKIGTTRQETGLIDPDTGNNLSTPLWGYGDQRDKIYTWPGRTFQIQSGLAGGTPQTKVFWKNTLNGVVEHLLPVDTNLHWCYALHNYTQHSIASAGVPIITHLHGGHSDYQFDGNPEFFYSPNQVVQGPQWANVPGGFTNKFRYDNNVPAGNLWYHDHALGITRLNVYAGLAGFYFIRDDQDTGKPDNPLDLPAWPYEKAYAIQDRMFRDTGELFYPAFPGEPYYDDFITGEGASLPPELFPNGGPSALAEFFGDHMVVNGKIWPKEDVEPRHYRMRLLNGTDSRFLAVRFRRVGPNRTNLSRAGKPLPFWVIGSDQGLADHAVRIKDDGSGMGGYLLIEPGSRYDIVFNFTGRDGQRIIMENIAGDEPFGGDIPGPQIFTETDRIMAFDVGVERDNSVADFFSARTFNKAQRSAIVVNSTPPHRIRKVALFEGKDEFGRLQPLLGTAEPATDYLGMPIKWPRTPVYKKVGLRGPMEGSIAWHSPTTENPVLGSTEEWEIWNMTGDAHPVHLHLVNFEILNREDIVWDSNTTEDDRFIPNKDFNEPAHDGTYLVKQPTVQHNSVAGDLTTYGVGFKIKGHSTTGTLITDSPPGYVENTPKDMVTALPGQVTRIKMTFDKHGRYVWHCHILSHEDHEMMRILHVGEGA